MERIVLFSIGGMDVYAYRAVLFLAAALCLVYGCMRARGLKGAVQFAVLSPVLAAVFSRLFYCLCRFEYTLYDLGAGSFFAFWQEGHMLYGGLAGIVLAALLASGFSGGSALPLLDAFTPALLLFTAAVKAAQGLAGEGYGAYLEEGSVWGRFPFAVYDGYYEEWAWALFLLAALAALIVFAVVVFTARDQRGDAFLTGLGLYAAMQIVLESLRRDDFLRWGFVRCSQVISAVIVAAVLAVFTVRMKGHRGIKLGLWAAALAMIAVCLLMEFAMEQRIRGLQFLSVGACYLVSAAGCTVLCGCLMAMRGLNAAKEKA